MNSEENSMRNKKKYAEMYDKLTDLYYNKTMQRSPLNLKLTCCLTDTVCRAQSHIF